MVYENHGAVVILFVVSFIFGILILVCQNPIYSLLSLIVTLSCVIFVFLILNIEFLALIFLIVYIGAIAILFLFVIMMFNIKRMRQTILTNEYLMILSISFIIIPKIFIFLMENVKNHLHAGLLNVSKNYFGTTKSNDFVFEYNSIEIFLKYKTNDVFIFSNLLYDEYSYCFGLIGAILFSAMICSIVLALVSSEKHTTTFK